MLVCAYGAEQAVKESMAAEGWRLAFSRPGFVTAKHDIEASLPAGRVHSHGRPIDRPSSQPGPAAADREVAGTTRLRESIGAPV